MADQDKPTPVAINLDKLEREGAKDPFVFRFEGERIETADIQEVDWQDLLIATENPRLLMRLIIPEEWQEKFFSAKLPSWKLNALMSAYFAHHGVDPEQLAASLR